MTELPGLLLMMGVLLSVPEDRFVLAGALSGLLMLTRPNAYLVVLVVVVSPSARWAGGGPRRRSGSRSPWSPLGAAQRGRGRNPKLVTSTGSPRRHVRTPAIESGGFMDPTVSSWYRTTASGHCRTTRPHGAIT